LTTVGLLARGEQEGRLAYDVDHLGRRPVRIRRRGKGSEHILTGLPAPLADVADELLFQPLQRVDGNRGVVQRSDGASRCIAGTKALAELGSILSRHAQQVGDHQRGERLGVLTEELAPTVGDELVELAIGQLPHEVLVLLQPRRGQQAAEQRAGAGVRRRVHRHHQLVDGKQMPVCLDLLGDVVPLGDERQRRERPADGVHRRKCLEVLERRDRLVVPGDRHDAVVGLAEHRVLRTQVGQVLVRILGDVLVGEVVDGGEIGHG
jgi:hypothetical protein